MRERTRTDEQFRQAQRAREARAADDVAKRAEGQGEDDAAPAEVRERPAERSKWPVRLGAAVLGAALIGAAALFGLGGDRVSDGEVRDRAAQYQTLRASGGLALAMVGFDELDRALDSMPVSEEQRETLRQEVSQGRTRLAWVTLWDTHAEDGDVLRFESAASLPVEVKALNAPTTLAIPYPADGKVFVTGVVDGGGGITIALESGSARIAWPTMQPGDTLELPVTPGP